MTRGGRHGCQLKKRSLPHPQEFVEGSCPRVVELGVSRPCPHRCPRVVATEEARVVAMPRGAVMEAEMAVETSEGQK